MLRKVFLISLLVVFSIQSSETNFDAEDPLGGLFDSNECLLDKNEAKSILSESYGISTSPDEKMRFILGKCNPVLLIPGIFCTQLRVKVNCKKLKANEPQKFMDTRVFCGNTVCKDENSENDEQVIFPAMLDSPYQLVETDGNKYSSCLGYFFQYYNSKDECPKTDSGDYVCNYSDNIRITFRGGTEKSKKDSDCGLGAIDNIIHTGNPLFDAGAHAAAPVAKVFHEAISKLKKMGYHEGFSLAGIPQDYRRFASTNPFAVKAFEYQINQLYANTGKPVVIVGHSYGTLLTLAQLLKSSSATLGKVKRFIALAPPFAGAGDLLNVFLYGHKDFNKKIDLGSLNVFNLYFDMFAQNMMFKALPSINELRPLNIVNTLFTSAEYKDFGAAVSERLALEKECANKNCDASYVTEHSKLFSAMFGNTFPSLNDAECKINSNNENENLLRRLISENNEPEILTAAYSAPCRSQMYNQATCPTVALKSSSFSINASELEKYCGTYNSNLLYNENCGVSGHSCLDSLYQEPPYAYRATAKVQYLIDRFNKNFSGTFGKTIDASYFESKASFNEKSRKMLEYHNKISVLKGLPIPPVDTTVVYANFLETKSAFVYEKGVDKENFDSNEVLYKGGDGTVPNWSSYLIGLKWLYDKKKQGKSQDIKLVEYCSPLSDSSNYAWSSTSTKTFTALKCSCYSNGAYKNTGDCNHAGMLGDDNLIEFIQKTIYDPNMSVPVTDERKKVVSSYNKDKSYVDECNAKLLEFAEL